MDIKQAFAELGLNPQASQADAKAAYRTLAMRWHPDVNSGVVTDSRMKAINVAYALVCQYQEALAKIQPRPAPAASGFSAFDWKTGFQPRAQAAAPLRSACVERTLRVSLFEAAFGCVKRINGMEPIACPRCAGSGEFATTWTVGSKCPRCLGQGLVRAAGESGLLQKCAPCHGSGLFKAAPPICPACKGNGRAEQRAWMVDVPIFAGTQDGALVDARDIRVRSGAHNLPRSFRLTVQIEKHPLFRLDKNRLMVRVPISVWRWLLGGEITVPTLEGSARVSLPSKPAALLVKDQGWPEYKAPKTRKPLFVMPHIIYPEALREEERRMLQLLELRSQMPEVQGWSRHVQAWVEPPAPESC